MPQESPTSSAAWPRLIQGGMGVYISGWVLARAVALLGYLGVISVTAVEQVWFYRLRNNTLNDIERMALQHFPDQKLVREMREFCQTHEFCPKWGYPVNITLARLAILASYCEVWCAKAGHEGMVGVNLMQKVQLPTLFYLYGAMLAKVDYVLVGAGIPTQFVGFLDTLTQNATTTQHLVEGMKIIEGYPIVFNPANYMENVPESPLPRPRFLPIITLDVLARRLVRQKRADGSRGVDGFIVEGPTAGGHNAPPRVEQYHPETGEPVYGPADETDLEVMRGIGVPFYLAGGYGHPHSFQEAIKPELGAAGVQVGTAFALCRESAMDPVYKERILDRIEQCNLTVLASPTDSPTGFPFQTPQLDWTVSNPEVFNNRRRLCDIGLLQEPHLRHDGTLVLACPAEPIEGPCGYLAKVLGPSNGTDDCHQQLEMYNKKAAGSRCLCNGLFGLTPYGRERKDGREPPAATLGQDLSAIYHFLNQGIRDFTAADVINYIVGNPA